jgi:hypothetical protein
MTKTATEELKDILEGLDVDKTGVVSLEDGKDTPLQFVAQKLLPGAKSLVVLAREVFPEVIRHLTSRVQVGELASVICTSAI